MTYGLEEEVRQLRSEHDALRKEIDTERRRRERASDVRMMVLYGVLTGINLLLFLISEWTKRS